nr:class I SAM-dependent methyltransferase [Oscillochloris trichoides]
MNKIEVVHHMESIKCPLCDSDKSITRYTIPDSLLGIPGLFVLVECAECGLLYQNPRPTRESIGYYYPPEYNIYISPPWSNPNLLQKILHLYGIKKRWNFVLRHAPKRIGKRRILDIGCATGVFLAAGDDSWQKIGVELSPQAAEQARYLFGLHVYTGMLEQAPLVGQKFDVITLWDVLEHLHDPLASLAYIRELLSPDGVCIIRVPNLSSWEAQFCGRYWGGLEQPRHLFIPDDRTIEQMLSRAGFSIIESASLGGTYHVFMQSWKFWLRQHQYTGWKFKIALRLLDNIIVRAILFPITWLVDRKFNKGSITTIAVKSL